MSRQEVHMKGTIALKDAIATLEDLVRSLRAGTVCIQNSAEHVALHPGSSISLEVEATAKKGKESLALKLSWEKESAEASNFHLRISPDVPAEAAPSEVSI